MTSPKPASSMINLNPGVTRLMDTSFSRAAKAIRAKAVEVGPALTGPSTSRVEAITLGGISGFQQLYAQCTIYYSEQTGAHEVHGEILRKFVTLPLKGLDLGFPVTDETPTPDQAGRYNHFSNDASIYCKTSPYPVLI